MVDGDGLDVGRGDGAVVSDLELELVRHGKCSAREREVRKKEAVDGEDLPRGKAFLDVEDHGLSVVLIGFQRRGDFVLGAASEGDRRDTRVPGHGKAGRDSNAQISLLCDRLIHRIVGDGDRFGLLRGRVDDKGLVEGGRDERAVERERMVVGVDDDGPAVDEKLQKIESGWRGEARVAQARNDNVVVGDKVRGDVEDEGLAEVFVADRAGDSRRGRPSENRGGGGAVPNDLDGVRDVDPDIVRRGNGRRCGVGDGDGAYRRRDIAEAKALVLVGEDVDRARDDVHGLVVEGGEQTVFEDFELQVVESGGRGEIEKSQVADRHLVACGEVGGDVDDRGAAAILVILELCIDLRRRGAPDSDVRDARIPSHGERCGNANPQVFLFGDKWRDRVIGNRDRGGEGRSGAYSKSLARGRGDPQVRNKDGRVVRVDLGLCGAAGDELEVVGG